MLLSLFFRVAFKIHISFLFIYFCIIFLHTNLPYFVKRPRAIVIDWALYKYFYYYYYYYYYINGQLVG